MTRKMISREDFYKLTGLLAIAKEHQRSLDTITTAAAQITGEEEDELGGWALGHTGDAISEGYPATELLKKLDIEIEGE